MLDQNLQNVENAHIFNDIDRSLAHTHTHTHTLTQPPPPPQPSPPVCEG